MSRLFTHQGEAARWLAARERAYLGDPPGFGKTRAILAGLHQADVSVHNVLVVTPAIVRTHWHREAADVGLQQMGHSLLRVKSFDEITRGGFPLMAEMLRQGVDTLIVDEAHYAKHATANRTRILLGKDGYARRVPRVWLASGTPMPRNPQELFTQLCYLVPELLLEYGVPTLEKWTERYCVTRPQYVRGVWRDKVVGVKNEDELRELLSHVMLRRSLDQLGMDVPQMHWQVTRLDTDAQYDRNRDLHNALDSEVWLEFTRALDNGELERIKNDPQIARMRRRLGELKVAPVVEMLRSQLADSDEKIVVFAHHKSVLHALRESLANFGVAYVDGDVTGSTRDGMIDMFQNEPSCRVFLGQNIACQTGITLTAARRVVLVEPDWMADVNYQLGQRLARIGQTAERCIGQMVCLAGTLDEAIVAQNKRETEMVAKVIGQAGPENVQ